MISNIARRCFTSTKYQIVLLRHGQSIWNKQNRFTGWTDVKLSSVGQQLLDVGINEAARAGRLLNQNGYEFDICCTSVLSRAIQTFNFAADYLNCHWIPIIKHWRLNERHYGALQGLNKQETAQKHGKQQVLIWRRSYDIQPPSLQKNDPRYPKNDPRYKDLKDSELPLTQSLKDTIQRVMPFWQNQIIPLVKGGKRVLVVAHGNSIRAIVKKLSNINEKDIVQLNIPTAVPLVYQFDQNFNTIGYKYIEQPQQKK